MRLPQINLIAALSPILVVCTPEAAANDRELLDMAVAGNTFSRESIHSIYIKFEATRFGNPPQETIRGEYWRQGEKWRLEHNDPDAKGKRIVHACDGVRIKSLANSPINGVIVQTGNIAAAGRKVTKVDPWQTAMMMVDLSTLGTFTIKDIVERGVKIDEVSSDEGMAVIRFKLDNGYVEVRMDPARNYMVSSVAGWGRAGQAARGEHRATKVRPLAPGVFFPEQVEYNLYQSGQPTLYRRTRFSEIRINASIPSDRFELAFPRGILVANRPKGELYRSDEQGRPLNPSTVRTIATPAPPPTEDLLRETTNEPRPMSRWLLPIGFGFVIIAGGIAVVRRWRRSKD